MPTAIDVLGDVSVSAEDGASVQVSGHGDTLTIDLPSLWVGRSIARQALGAADRQGAIARLQAGLRRTGLTLQVRVAGRRVARLAPGSKGSPLARLLRLGAMEVAPLGLLLALFRRSPASPTGYRSDGS